MQSIREQIIQTVVASLGGSILVCRTLGRGFFADHEVSQFVGIESLLPFAPRRTAVTSQPTRNDFPVDIHGAHPNEMPLIFLKPEHPAHRFHHPIDRLRAGRQGSVKMLVIR